MENLQELHITSVSVTGGISLDAGGYEELSDALGRHQNNWPRRPIDKLGFYEVDGIRHHLGLEIELVRSINPNVARFTLETHSFSRNERLRLYTLERQKQQFAEIQAILSDLEKLNLNSRIQSHISWIFPPDSRKPIISLPMMTVQHPSIPFAEITGIRLKKTTDVGLTTVTIDLRGDRSLATTLVLPLPGVEISERIINHATQRGSRIIKDFVLTSDIPAEDGET